VIVKKLVPYFLLGGAFGFVLLEAEAVSWFRIQEMFRFDAFQMYGIILSAVFTAMVSLQMIRRLGLVDVEKKPLSLEPKKVGKGIRYVVGGAVFGLGWSFTGACPGPLVALVGAGMPVMLVAIVSALLGTWTYGLLRARLPH
jgi:uncharacterized membrane protein YedE/YeeE